MTPNPPTAGNCEPAAKNKAPAGEPIAVVEIKTVPNIELNLGDNRLRRIPFDLFQNPAIGIDPGRNARVRGNHQWLTHFYSPKNAARQVHIELVGAAEPTIVSDVDQYVG